MASQALRAGRDRLEPTVAGRVWTQLRELDVFNSSLEFAAVFTGFIPFLMVSRTRSAQFGPRHHHRGAV
jgi:hypothetical protein